MSTFLSKQKLADFIRSRRFSDLFIELGWDTGNLPKQPLVLKFKDDQSLHINRITEKRGFVVCVYDAGKNYPDTKVQRRYLVNQLARHHYEHLLIICGEGRQCWTVAIRPQNRPLRTVEVEWWENQDIQPLKEKLDGLLFDIREEDSLAITDVVDKVRSAFMVGAEKVTRKFYGEFQKELQEFSNLIQGLKNVVSEEWYAALMLNRLMFIYFIQRKGFLDGDRNYLENRLNRTQEQFGRDEFDRRFYRHFLRKLFSEGLGTPEEKRAPELRNLLGKVPYLNGGLFDVHEIEQENKDIEIPDRAFENLFAFFGRYNWNLDTRATATGKDINPDVIGYIFEKYINDRAKMGAYYTQEDITGYISRNTIIPFLLNRAREKCKNAFDRQNGIWRFLRENPDSYIYDAVGKGCDIPDEEIPENVRRGMDTQVLDLLERRKHWNTKTEECFALPTEIWRETMARRKRYFELKAKIENGAIHEIDDLITHNLDLERFISDALRHYEGSDFIAAFYEAIAGRKALQSNQTETRGITVLDPACGSGAFLFAALNALEPLYEQCINRMEDFIEEDDRLREQGKRSGTKKYPQFRAVLAEIAEHPNRKYWIYKTIILNNLYGVDLMQEATEIAKLRLFLKLAAEAEYDPSRDNLGLEPLPDIDFNIRSGNSLVGFASMQQFERALAPEQGQQSLYLHEELTKEIRRKAVEIEKANARFRSAQNESGDEYQNAKQKLKQRLDTLNDRMSRYLVLEYGINTKKKGNYERWLKSHQPFHWLVEFYGIVEENGGFDVVIGNPPYVEYEEVDYTIKDYKTHKCGNLYAYMLERTMKIQNYKSHFGMIVPISVNSTDGYQSLQNLLLQKSSLYTASFSHLVGKLFDISNPRLCIVLYRNKENAHTNGIYTTCYNKLGSGKYRNTIFQRIEYVDVSEIRKNFLYKFGTCIEKSIFKKIFKKDLLLMDRTGKEIYFIRKFGWYVSITDFIPEVRDRQGNKRLPGELKAIYFANKSEACKAFVALNSNLFYWLVTLTSDCRHLNKREINNFPISVKDTKLDDLLSMGNHLSESLNLTSEMRTYGKLKIQYLFHRKIKHLIDKIDFILAGYYGLTEEELDYIINYDIKYRMELAK